MVVRITKILSIALFMALFVGNNIFLKAREAQDFVEQIAPIAESNQSEVLVVFDPEVAKKHFDKEASLVAISEEQQQGNELNVYEMIKEEALNRQIKAHRELRKGKIYRKVGKMLFVSNMLLGYFTYLSAENEYVPYAFFATAFASALGYARGACLGLRANWSLLMHKDIKS